MNDASTDEQVEVATQAIADAREAIEGRPMFRPKRKARNSGTVSILETSLASAKTSRTTAMNAADEEERKAMAAAGKALHGAMGTDPLRASFLSAC